MSNPFHADTRVRLPRHVHGGSLEAEVDIDVEAAVPKRRDAARALLEELEEACEEVLEDFDPEAATHRLADAEPRTQPSPPPWEDDDEPTCYECGAELSAEWALRDKEAQEQGTHPADCPECGENPLPPVGEGDAE